MSSSTRRKLSLSKSTSTYLQPNLLSPHSLTITPPTVATVPSAVSPLISTLPGYINRLRPPKLPLYVPAVLRPTDPPRRAIRENVLPNNRDESLRRTKSARKRNNGLDTRSNYPNLDTLSLEKVKGPPTRMHWKPDVLSTHCDLSSGLCTREFTTFHRRHHCRRCGLIFCHLHSLYSIPLDQDANFHPLGTRVRACEACWANWVDFINSAPDKLEDADPGSMFGIEPLTPVFNPGSITNDFNNSMDGETATQMFANSPEQVSVPVEMGATAQSVPRDWHWSTF